MATLFSKIAAAALTATALCGCSAMDRLEHIGEAPKLTAMDNPAGRQLNRRVEIFIPASL